MIIPVVETSSHTVDDNLPCLMQVEDPLHPSLHRRHHVQPRKRVSFADEALLYSSPLSQFEVQQLWYSRDDYARFKKDRKLSVKLLRTHSRDQVEENVCLRGFEAYFSVEINRVIRFTREAATRDVLLEQKKQVQRMGRLYDHEAIRAVYLPATALLGNQARVLAQQDAKEAAENALQPEVSYSARQTFQIAMMNQRSQRRLMQEDDFEHMDGIMRKLDNAMNLVGKMDLNEAHFMSHATDEPIRLDRMDMLRRP